MNQCRKNLWQMTEPVDASVEDERAYLCISKIKTAPTLHMCEGGRSESCAYVSRKRSRLFQNVPGLLVVSLVLVERARSQSRG